MYNHILYLSFWLVNFLVFYIFGSFFPNDVVLGIWKYTPVEAAIYSSFWLTFIVWTGWDFIYSRGLKYQAGSIAWVYFWILNTLGIWLIARFANVLGLGISNWSWAIIIAVFAVMFQKIVWTFVTGRNLNTQI